MLLSLGMILLLAATSHVAAKDPTRAPILLDSSGGFVVGGKTIQNPRYPSQTLSCDHAYVEYFIPWTPRRTSLLMWHSSTTQSWQNRWGGGEGYKDMWLRRNYPVYLWDGPRVGRANWSCKEWRYVPNYRDQGNFNAWNLGPTLSNGGRVSSFRLRTRRRGTRPRLLGMSNSTRPKTSSYSLTQPHWLQIRASWVTKLSSSPTPQQGFGPSSPQSRAIRAISRQSLRTRAMGLCTPTPQAFERGEAALGRLSCLRRTLDG
jgi:hypothetical protein